MKKGQIAKCALILSVFPIVFCWSQSQSIYNNYGRKHIHIPFRSSKPNNKDTIPLEPDITSEKAGFSWKVTLRNFKKGEIDHPQKKEFIKKIIEIITKSPDDKQIIDIEFIGWADGLHNRGINPKKFNIEFDCKRLINTDTIFDQDLAVLRACQMKQLLSSKKKEIPIKFDKLIDMHLPQGVDEPDNVDTGGEYRKVIAIIKY